MAFLSIVLSIPILGRRNVYIYMMINKQLRAKNHVYKVKEFLINFIKTGSTGLVFYFHQLYVKVGFYFFYCKQISHTFVWLFRVFSRVFFAGWRLY